MLNIIMQHIITKDEDTIFNLLVTAKERDLTDKEKTKFLKAMSRSIYFSLNAFLREKEKEDNTSLDIIIINNGLNLLNDLNNGFEITIDNCTLENINQISAHFQSILEYENSFLDYKDDNSKDNFLKTLNKFEKAKDFSEGYKEKTLTKN